MQGARARGWALHSRECSSLSVRRSRKSVRGGTRSALSRHTHALCSPARARVLFFPVLRMRAASVLVAARARLVAHTCLLPRPSFLSAGPPLARAPHPVLRRQPHAPTTRPMASTPPPAPAAAAAAAAGAGADPAADVLVVYVTVPDAAAADRVADAVIAPRLAACVNIVPGLTSVYRWKGVVERSAESLLIIKTTRPRLAALTAAVKAAHPYEVPEVLALPAAGGSADYLQWVADESAG